MWHHLNDNELRLWTSSSQKFCQEDVGRCLCRALEAATDRFPAEASRTKNATDELGQLTNILTLFIKRFLPLVSGAHSPAYVSPRIEQILRDPKFLTRREDVSRLRRAGFGTDLEQCCFAPLCRNTYACREAHFRACGGCKTAVYCSRKCQKSAWTYLGAAHRDICFMYALYRATLSREREKRGRHETSSALDNAAFEAAAHALSPTQLEAVCTNLHKLQEIRLVRLRKRLLALLKYKFRH
jgi:hypothetical protein